MRVRLFLSILTLALLRANSLWALPVLQLDIVDGIYDPTTQTTIATSSSFTVRALLNGDWNSGTYYLSSAITPGQSLTNPAPNFGSVVIDSVQYLPAAFNYGTPPVDVLDSNQGNLATHSVFPTYYLEHGFVFDSAHTVSAYNVQDNSSAPGLLYYHDFTVDVSALLPDYTLHFDLYNEAVRRNGNYGVACFAPFSHDAESGPHLVPDREATLILLGIGCLLLLAIALRKSVTSKR